MIDLGESEKITAVLKLVLIFFTMGRSNFDFLVNIFGKRSFWCFKLYAYFFSYSPEHKKLVPGSCEDIVIEVLRNISNPKIQEGDNFFFFLSG